MFGIGGDDKDKLKENMEEIKDMVNNSSPGQQSPEEQESQIDQLEKEFSSDFEESGDDNSQPQNLQGSEQTRSFSDQAEQQPKQNDISEPSGKTFEERFNTESNTTGQSQQSFEKAQNTPEQDQNPQNKNNTQQPGNDVQKFDSPPQNQTSQNQETQDRQPQQKKQSQEQKTSTQSTHESSTQQNNSTNSRLNDSIPEPAETKDINVPEIDKGPLFIRRQKFESAKNMIEEMRYISREIEDVVNQLERGIEEDQATENEAKELLHSLEKDRSNVKKIISQQNEQKE